MDDYNVLSLNNSQHEWAIKLLNTITPYIIEGVDSIFDEAYRLCKENNESEKYLMTFQNLLSRIPKWNNAMITAETNRIIEKSKCVYLEDLISCVHISHLKILTSIRVGKTQKKINIDVPNLNDFIHKVYINCGRKLYTVVYLFEKGIEPLICQKYKKEVEEHVRNCILNTVRDSIPVEEILRAYMDESTDLVASTVKEPVKELTEPDTHTTIETSGDPITSEPTIKLSDNATVDLKDKSDLPIVSKIPEIKETSIVTKLPDEHETPIVKALTSSEEPNVTLAFSEIDKTIDVNKNEEQVAAPKDIETLEKLSDDRHEQRKQEEEAYESDNETIKISNDPVKLDILDIQTIEPSINQSPLLSDVEVLE